MDPPPGRCRNPVRRCRTTAIFCSIDRSRTSRLACSLCSFGLHKKSSAPSCSPSTATIEPAFVSALTRIVSTGGSGFSRTFRLVISRSVSSPPIPGISTSSVIRSTGVVAMNSRAFSPLKTEPTTLHARNLLQDRLQHASKNARVIDDQNTDRFRGFHYAGS